MTNRPFDKRSSDEDLMLWFRRGSVDAYDILYERHFLFIANWLWSNFRNLPRYLHEDVVQETMESLFRNGHSPNVGHSKLTLSLIHI